MASPAYRFGEFRLEPASRQLWRGDEEVALHRRAFDCIVYLLEHRDRAVTRDELVAAVWGDVYLTDGALGQAIYWARRALDDSDQEKRVIRTMWGFGYRWVAPVEVVEPPPATALPVSVEPERSPRRPVWPWILAAALGVGGLSAATAFLVRHTDRDVSETRLATSAQAEIALLLPVRVEPEGEASWIRFGAMELIAERLRASGQPMVPSATAIALSQELPEVPQSQDLARLSSGTGARHVLAARARRVDAHWQVSVRSVDGIEPPITARGEAADVLVAARRAADETARALGLTPSLRPDAAPNVTRLLRRTDAAMLAQRLDLARELIATADPKLRRHPEARLRLAWIEYSLFDLDAARDIFESLRADPAVRRDPVLYARTLHGLGGIDFQDGDQGAAETVLDEAVKLLRDDSPPQVRGQIRRSFGLVMLAQGRFEDARLHFAEARRAFQATGDARGLTVLDNHLGVLEALGERYAAALHHFAAAADGLAALHDTGEELRARTNLVETALGLLDLPQAQRLEPRIIELIAQATSPELVAQGRLARVALLTRAGHLREAERVLAEVLRTIERDDLPTTLKAWALVLEAERLARSGDSAGAATVAAEVVDDLSAASDPHTDHYLGRAWRIVLHARLASGDVETASEIAAAMRRWAEGRPTRGPKIHTAMAAAEVAAARRQTKAARAGFEEALELADGGFVPLHLLQVAEAYLPWLLEQETGVARSDRALLIADRVAGYAEHDFAAALVQLRVYQALGPPSAWQSALHRADALAGERDIPSPLLAEPPAAALAAR